MTELPGPIVFDLDGTLIDSAADLTEALNRVLADQRLPAVAEESVRHMVGDGAVKLIERGFAAAGRRMDGHLPEALRQAFLDHYAACLTERTTVHPGVAEALAALGAAGRRMAVCTNKPAAMSETILAHLGLARHFDAVLGGDSLAVRKPHPAHLIAAIAQSGGDAPRAVMVGDSRNDVATARAAGVPVVVVSFGYTSVAPHALGADAVIDHFDELLAALAGLTQPEGA
jgi:phosphoglycolate phosphatase